jgi:tripartite-type tricarboxylate transporter receptor subunit TctC
MGDAGNLGITHALYPNLPFDTQRDFVGVAQLTAGPSVLVVSSAVPARDMREFVALLKARPDALNFGSAGIGSGPHLFYESWRRAAGVSMTHVPYRGTGPALNDIVAGHVDLIFMELSAAHKLHDSGKARILAIATDQRSDLMPEIPTLGEIGLPNFVSDTWNALSAPPKTPRPIIEKLNRAVNDIVTEPETKERFRALNLIAAPGTPEDMAKLKREETERWSKVIRDANIKAE